YRQAFAGDTIHAVISAIARDMPTPLRALMPDLDPAIEAIVMRAIQKEPQNRYQTMAALAVDVARVRDAWRTRRPTGNTTVLADVQTPPPGYRTPRPSTPSRQLISKRRQEAIDRHLHAARQAFDAGDYAAALEACDQAALIDPDEPRVIDLLDRAKYALDHQKIHELVGEARGHLDPQELDQAADLVEQARDIDPASETVLRAQAEIDDVREKERQRQHAIITALARARDGLSNGNFESAIRAAGEVLVYDPGNQEGLDLSRQAVRALEERRERDAQRRAAQGFVDQQQQAFASGRRREAIDALDRYAPPHELTAAAAADLRARLADIERHEAEEAERRRREAEEAEQRRQAQQRWAALQMESAGAAIKAKRFAEAINLLGEVQRTMPGAPGLEDLLRTAQAAQASAEAEARRHAEAAEKVNASGQELTRGRLTEALALVDAALALFPDYGPARARRSEIEAALEARRRQEEHDRAAAAAVDAARTLFEAGDHAKALASLDALTPPHPAAARAREELRVKLAEIERAADARRRLDEAGREVDRAERAFAARDFLGAINALNHADALSPGIERSSRVRARLLETLEDERRQEELRIRAEQTIAEARRRFAAGDSKAALSLLEQFAPAHQAVTDALASLRQAFADQEARARQADEERVREEDRRHAEAEARHAEQRRQAEEDERRRRQQATADALQRARSAATARDAVAVLKEALRADPDHRECLDLLASRQAEMTAEIGRTIEAGELDRAARAIDDVAALGVAPSALAALRDQMAAARAAAAPAASTLADSVPTAYAPEADRSTAPDGRTARPEAPAARARWMAAAAAVLLVAGVVWYATRPGPLRPPQPTTSTVSTVATSAPTTIPPTSIAPPVPDTGAIVAAARTEVGRGNLSQAMAGIVAGLKASPDDRDLRDMIQEIFRAAEGRVSAVRRSAEAAGGRNRQEYAQALSHLRNGATLRRSGRVESAEQSLGEYVTAAGLFSEAARSTGVSVNTTMPPTVVTTPTTVPPTIASTVPTTVPTSVTTTVPATTTIAPAVDMATIRRLLEAYAAAAKTLNPAEIQKIFPALPETTKLRLEALQRDYRYCDYTFSNIRLVSATAIEAIVRLDSVEACRAKISTRVPPNPLVHQQITFRRTAGGAWVIVEILGS
ncbi:MAG TPA: hypothetical protein VL309_11560, partial [Vicinamibacterales bacterium]|nr:hypothetical protein [Vicinamibacterales bacterium]